MRNPRSAILAYLEGHRLMDADLVTSASHPTERARYGRQHDVAEDQIDEAYAAYVRADWQNTELEAFDYAVAETLHVSDTEWRFRVEVVQHNGGTRRQHGWWINVVRHGASWFIAPMG